MLEIEDGSNLRWLVAAALIALGMALVATRYEDAPSTGRANASASVSLAAQPAGAQTSPQ